MGRVTRSFSIDRETSGYALSICSLMTDLKLAPACIGRNLMYKRSLVCAVFDAALI
jgi:hypothetical protein